MNYYIHSELSAGMFKEKSGRVVLFDAIVLFEKFIKFGKLKFNKPGSMELVIKSLRRLRKIVITIIGFTVLLIGVILIFLPGPSLLVIPAGLAILGTEFLWARNLLKKLKSIRFKKRRESEPDQERQAA